MLELHYPTVTKTILERQYPGKPTLKVAFGNDNGAIFENSSKLRASLFVTSRWPRSSGQTNYQVHHPPCFRCFVWITKFTFFLATVIIAQVLKEKWLTITSFAHSQTTNKLVNEDANDSALVSRQDRKKLPALGTNQIAGFGGFRPLSSLEENKCYIFTLICYLDITSSNVNLFTDNCFFDRTL